MRLAYWLGCGLVTSTASDLESIRSNDILVGTSSFDYNLVLAHFVRVAQWPHAIRSLAIHDNLSV